MQAERDQILNIVEALEHISGRPAMFAGSKTVAAVSVFLNGFDIACSLVGINKSLEAQSRAMSERGWKYNAEAWGISQMRARGMTEEAMVDEMLALEICAWSLTADTTDG